ncbi:MAG TPA: alpha/beta hydrolase family protein [Bryobacteraceae bacterium]|nr:alpha/beta hydrolase family protein [Bryobacteraceae bacterium]
MTNLNRRAFLMTSGAALGRAVLPAQQAVTAASYAEQYPDMLLRYLSARLNALSERWDRERAAIRTAEAVAERNRFVRGKFVEMIHGYPERNPLRPVVVKVLERDGYRVENIMFESRPNFFVTGNLYAPTSGPGPFPAILSPCGHYPLARMQPDYQFVYLNLVKAGFVVLGYDPIGQGERRYYWDPRTDETESALGPVYEHSMPGQLLLLLGENLSAYRIWDGMRGIDYLLTRPEVDKEKIGCAGHSGGGTLTLFISALDERVRCAVVNEGGTGHRWPVHIAPGGPFGPSDVEQNLFPSALYGADLCDLHVAIAPRPLLTLTEEYSPWFNLAAGHIRDRYRQFGVAEKFATEEATDPHAYTVRLRQATTDWFSHWFYGRKGPEAEPDFDAEPRRNLYCTPNGSVRYSQQGDTIFSLILKRQASLPEESKPPSSRREWEEWRGRFLPTLKELLRYKPVTGPLGVRPLVTTARKGYRVEKLEFLSEPDIYIPTWVFLPQTRNAETRAILYLNDAGIAGEGLEGMEFGVLEELARKGHLVVAVEPRGTGLTAPEHSEGVSEAPEFRQLFDTETAAAYMAWFMDESLLGMRVFDVIRSVDYALTRNDVDKRGLRAIGTGRGATWLLFAAALDPRIQATVCDRGLLSYKSLAQSDRYLYGADVFIPGVLKRLDLPQVAAAVADRSLTLLSPLDPMKKLVDVSEATVAYDRTRRTYTGAQVGGQFRILRREPELSLSDQYLHAFET